MIFEKNGTKTTIEFDFKELQISVSFACKYLIQIFSNYENSEMKEIKFGTSNADSKIKTVAIIFPLQENIIKIYVYIQASSGLKNAGFVKFDVYSWILKKEREVTLPLFNCPDKNATLRFGFDYSRPPNISENPNSISSIPNIHFTNDKSNEELVVGTKKIEITDKSPDVKQNRRRVDEMSRELTKYITGVESRTKRGEDLRKFNMTPEIFSNRVTNQQLMFRDMASSHLVEPNSSTRNNTKIRNVEEIIAKYSSINKDKSPDLQHSVENDLKKRDLSGSNFKQRFAFNQRLDQPNKSQNNSKLPGMSATMYYKSSFHIGENNDPKQKKVNTPKPFEQNPVFNEKIKLTSIGSLPMPKSPLRMPVTVTKFESYKGFNSDAKNDFTVDMDRTLSNKDHILEDSGNRLKRVNLDLKKLDPNAIFSPKGADGIRIKEQKITELKDQLCKEQENNMFIGQDLERKKKQIASLEKTCEDLKRDLKFYEDENNTLNRKMEQLEEEVKDKYDLLRQIEDDRRAKEIEIDNEKEVFTEQIQKLKTMIESLYDNRESLHKLPNHKSDENLVYMSQSPFLSPENQNQNESEIKRLNDLIINLTARLETRNNMVDSFMSDSSGIFKLGKHDGLEPRQDFFFPEEKRRISEKRMEESVFQKTEREMLKAQRDKIQKDYDQLQAECDQFRKSCERARKDLTNVSVDKFEWKTKIELLQTEIISFTEQLKAKEDEIENLKAEIQLSQKRDAGLEEQIDGLKYDTEVLEEQLSFKEKDLKEANEKLQHAEQLYADLLVIYKTRTLEYEQLQAVHEDTKTEKEELRSKIDSMFELKTSQIQKIKDMYNQVVDEKEQLSNIVPSLENQIELLKSQNTDLLESLNISKRKFTDLEQRYREKEQKVSAELSLVKESSLMEFSVNIAHKDDQIQSLLERIAGLETQQEYFSLSNRDFKLKLDNQISGNLHLQEQLGKTTDDVVELYLNSIVQESETKLSNEESLEVINNWLRKLHALFNDKLGTQYIPDNFEMTQNSINQQFQAIFTKVDEIVTISEQKIQRQEMEFIVKQDALCYEFASRIESLEKTVDQQNLTLSDYRNNEDNYNSKISELQLLYEQKTKQADYHAVVVSEIDQKWKSDFEEISIKNKILQNDVDVFNTKLEDLRIDNESLRQQLTENQADFEKDLEIKNLEIAKSTQKYNEFSQLDSEKTNVVSNLQTQLEATQNRILKLQKNIKKMFEISQSHINMIDEKHVQIDQTVRAKIQRFSEKTKLTKLILSELTAKSDQSISTLERTTAGMQKYKKQKREKSRQLQELQKSFGQLSEKLNNSEEEKSKVTDGLASTNMKVSEQELIIGTLKNSILAMEEEKEKVTKNLRHHSDNSLEEINNLKIEIDNLKEEKSDLLKQVVIQANLISKHDSNRVQLVKRSQILSGRVSALDMLFGNKIENFLQKIVLLQAKCSQEISSNYSNIENLQMQLEETKTVLARKVETLSQQLVILREENMIKEADSEANIVDIRQSSKIEIDILSKSINEKDIQISDLKNQNSELALLLEKLKHENEELSASQAKTIAEKISIQEELTNKIKKMETEIDERSFEVSKQKKSNSQKEKEINLMHAKVEELQAYVTSLKTDVNFSKSTFDFQDQKIAGLEATNASQTEEINKFENLILELEKKNQDLSAQISSLDKHKSDLDSQLSLLRSDHANSTRASQEKEQSYLTSKSAMEAKIQEFDLLLQSKETINADLRKALEVLTVNFQKETEQVDQLQKDLSLKSVALLQVEKSLCHSEETLKSTKLELETAQKELNHLQTVFNENETLVKRSAKAEQANVTLQQEKEQLLNNIEELNRLVLGISLLETKLREKEVEHKDLFTQIKSMETEHLQKTRDFQMIIENLNLEKEDLVEQIKIIPSLHSKSEQTAIQLDELTRKNEHLEISLNEQSDLMKTQYSELISKNQSLESQIVNLNEEIKRLSAIESSLADLNKELDNQKTQKMELQNTIDQFKAQYEKTLGLNEVLSDKCAHFTAEIDEINDNLIKKTQELDKANNDCLQKSLEIKSLSEKIDDSTKKLHFEVQRHCLEIETLKIEFQSQLKTTSEVLDQLTNDKRTLLSEKDNQREIFQAQISELHIRIHDINTKYQEQIDSVRTKKEAEIEAIISKSSAEVQDQHASLLKYESMRKELETSLSEQKKESEEKINSHIQTINELKDQVIQLKDQVLEVTKNNLALTEDDTRTKIVVEKQNHEITNLRVSCKDAKSKISDLENLLQEKATLAESVQVMLNESRESISKLEFEQKLNQENMIQLEKTLVEEQLRVTKMNSEITELVSKINEAQEAHQLFVQEMEVKHKGQITQIEKQQHEKIIELESKINKTEQINRLLKEQFDDLSQREQQVILLDIQNFQRRSDQPPDQN